MKRDAKPAGAMPATVRKLRCAVYTRKSSEEGLDMEFNSLDAQREACEAFIASQRAEGWVLVRERYDDGGISGGTLERPALKRLVADIQEGLVDVVVVYKIDRLSRSLVDFTKLVEVFDANNVTFVSVTQSFNTTTSMGRLTLNVLLSFAQFEREVTGERIRDKIAASKKKGLWMGGVVPLGYRVEARKLIIEPREAELVRSILVSLAEAYAVNIRRASELSGVAVRTVHIVGGGSQNALLCRLTAQATGLPVVAVSRRPARRCPPVITRKGGETSTRAPTLGLQSPGRGNGTRSGLLDDRVVACTSGRKEARPCH